PPIVVRARQRVGRGVVEAVVLLGRKIGVRACRRQRERHAVAPAAAELRRDQLAIQVRLPGGRREELFEAVTVLREDPERDEAAVWPELVLRLRNRVRVVVVLTLVAEEELAGRRLWEDVRQRRGKGTVDRRLREAVAVTEVGDISRQRAAVVRGQLDERRA